MKKIDFILGLSAFIFAAAFSLPIDDYSNADAEEVSYTNFDNSADKVILGRNVPVAPENGTAHAPKSVYTAVTEVSEICNTGGVYYYKDKSTEKLLGAIWDLDYGEMCGPDRHCDYRKNLNCFTLFIDNSMAGNSTCKCDERFPRYSQWSGSDCLMKDGYPCQCDDECASQNCTLATVDVNRTCQPEEFSVNRKTESPSSSSTLIIHIVNIFLVWFVGTLLPEV